MDEQLKSRLAAACQGMTAEEIQGAIEQSAIAGQVPDPAKLAAYILEECGEEGPESGY